MNRSSSAEWQALEFAYEKICKELAPRFDREITPYNYESKVREIYGNVMKKLPAGEHIVTIRKRKDWFLWRHTRWIQKKEHILLDLPIEKVTTPSFKERVIHKMRGRHFSMLAAYKSHVASGRIHRGNFNTVPQFIQEQIYQEIIAYERQQAEIARLERVRRDQERFALLSQAGEIEEELTELSSVVEMEGFFEQTGQQFMTLEERWHSLKASPVIRAETELCKKIEELFREVSQTMTPDMRKTFFLQKKMGTVGAISQFAIKHLDALRKLHQSNIYLISLLRKEHYSLEEISHIVREEYQKRTGKELFREVGQKITPEVEKMNKVRVISHFMGETNVAKKLHSAEIYLISLLRKEQYSLEEVHHIAREEYKNRTGKELFT